MDFKMVMSEKEMEKRMKLASDIPFHRFLGIDVIETRPGFSTCHLSASENTINLGGVIHGGIIYSMLDFSAYLSLMPMLRDTQNAVTHDIHVSVLLPAPIDKSLVLKSQIRKMGKRIAFCDSEAYSGDKLVATGRITKSIIEIKPLKE